MHTDLGPILALYPTLTAIVGAHRDGRPNFLAVAHLCPMNHGQPQYLAIGLNKAHYTNMGILENRQFSICIPSQDLLVETDYVGIVSGKKTDKSGLFDVFYGQLPAAPLIRECPVCMECRLHQTLVLGNHDIFIGELVATHADPDVLTDGTIDFAKVRPMLFDMPLKKYRALGPVLGDCWSAGKALKREAAE
ncbi:flavin reductase [Desulfovibrio aminophilus]|uniref:flavin reductase family protein n=1 Tax=Desulfovibrio aminophilus TaxID=81425 RepID=UPI003390AB4B